MAIYAVAVGAIPAIRGAVQLGVVAVLLGIAGGMIIVLYFAVWSEAFGGRELGRIQGAAQMLTVVSSAVGPLCFAEVHALTGSYAPMLYGLVPAAAFTGVVAWFVRFPAPRTGAAIPAPGGP